jgi:multidrug transporter EmrE-like cation transporter
MWRSFPTVPAVACYALATTLAPVAVVQAIFSSVALFAAMIGGLIYKERLQTIQMIALIVLVAFIAIFKYMN